MKYMLMMNTPGGGPYQISNWPKKDIEAHIEFMKTFSKKLAANGELAGDSPARAYAIAAEASTAPGPGGKPLYLKIEVRQVMSVPASDYVP